jgi:SAM-dependent MidA family methyltransferase
MSAHTVAVCALSLQSDYDVVFNIPRGGYNISSYGDFLTAPTLTPNFAEVVGDEVKLQLATRKGWEHSHIGSHECRLRQIEI